jgi:hypothetical protein
MSVNQRNETPRIPSELWRVIMDGNTFDQLIKHLATTRVTRLTALRGLVVGAVAALTGLGLTADEVGAARKKPRKKAWCHRGDDFSIVGTTRKLTKDQRQKHRRRDAADYKGRCTASRIVSPTNTTTTTTAPPAPPGFDCRVAGAGCVGPRAGLICDQSTGQCVNCTTYTQCGTVPGAGARACLAGVCRGGESCTTNEECVNPPLFCLNPVLDLTRLICQFDNECDADTGINGCASTPATPICVLGYCTNACAPGDDCGPGKACQGRVCVFT